MDWERTLIAPAASVRDAMRAIMESSLQIGLVVDDERRLLGTVTDGDIRRAILEGIDLENSVAAVMNTNPRTALMGTSDDALLAVMKSKVLHQVPLLDEDGRVVGLAHIEDFLSAPPTRENWVVLMAGGLGMRLRPLTESTPKSLVSVGNKPLLETILESFVRHSFRRFYISVNYKAEAIKQHFGDGSEWGADIRYLEEDTAMGTAGALRLLPERPDAPIIVMNSDLLTQVNFGELLRYHQQQGSQATMCVREYDFQVPFGVVEIDDHRIKGIDEKPVQRFFVNAGIYVLDPGMIDLIGDETPFDMTTLFQNIIRADHTTAVFPIHEYWLDVGRLEDFNRANSEFEKVFKR